MSVRLSAGRQGSQESENKMIIDVITIFPEMFIPVIGESIIKRGRAKGLVKINIHDLRDYSSNIHKKVDSPSYGGGGMVFKIDPLFESIKSILNNEKKILVKGINMKVSRPKTKGVDKPRNLTKDSFNEFYENKIKDKTKRTILFSPKGKKLNQKMMNKFLSYEKLILIAPRYEGVDERVREYLVDEEISIGDYVLSGGELPAMVFIDSLVRLIPGVVSDKNSIKNESFENSLLDFPHYTRPAEFCGLKVPDILISGNHKDIEKWRKDKAFELTKKRRPDLLNEKKDFKK